MVQKKKKNYKEIFNDLFISLDVIATVSIDYFIFIFFLLYYSNSSMNILYYQALYLSIYDYTVIVNAVEHL